MSLYISWALQSAGLGRSAMNATERLVRLSPFSRDVIARDTMQKHFQLGDNNFGKAHDNPGAKTSELRASEEWYTRQGYEIVERVDRGYDWEDPTSGELVPVPLVYMMKNLI